MPVHLRPSAPTAADALLCGDPARALAIAQRLLVKPRMSNHHRGLWGYYGETPTGAALTVQSTGIGGPSAAVVVDELAELGLRRAIRVGSCVAPASAPAAGTGLVVEAAIGADGTSLALGQPRGEPLLPDPALQAVLLEESGLPASTVHSGDLRRSGPGAAGEESSAPVRDLQTAGLFAACHAAGVAVAALLAVAEADGRRLEDEPLEATMLRLAAAAAASFARTT